MSKVLKKPRNLRETHPPCCASCKHAIEERWGPCELDFMTVCERDRDVVIDIDNGNNMVCDFFKRR